jgi:hypothetical protein
MSSGTEVLAVVHSRAPRHSQQAFRVLQMKRLHALSQGNTRHTFKSTSRDANAPRPPRFAGEGADAVSQATGRQEKVVKMPEWVMGPGGSRLSLENVRLLKPAPNLHSMLKELTDNRMIDPLYAATLK